MGLILIRGENHLKILNAIADIERHASLNISSYPKKIDSKFADLLVEKILKSPLRTKSKVATAFFVKEDTTFSIIQIKKIHPPAHIIVVSNEYKEYAKLKEKLNNASNFKGYYSNKNKETELKDYKSNNKNILKTNREFKNNQFV
ncbi:MAG: DUF356 domain-containing protein [Methanobacteriaceae archaeon]|nr:DUF356 domain-containing protein [Candidatus Methanorudis spinitermitis]